MILEVIKRLIIKNKEIILWLSLYLNIYIANQNIYLLLAFSMALQAFFMYKEKKILGVLWLGAFGIPFPFFALGMIEFCLRGLGFESYALYSLNSITEVLVFISGAIIVSIFILDKLKVFKLVEIIYKNVKESYSEVKKERDIK